MSESYMNNPMMNLWKNFLDNPSNPMSIFTKNMEFLKSYMPGSFPNFSSWMNMGNANPQSGAYNFADNFKDMGGFSETQKLSFENVQAIARRQAEIIQKHAQELVKLFQKAMSTNNPEETVKRNTDFVHSSFDLLIADFKELTELYSKANMETFEAVSNRFKSHLEKVAPCGGNGSCNATDCHDESKESSAKKKK